MAQSPAERPIIRTATKDHCENCGQDFEETVERTFDANIQTVGFICRRCKVDGEIEIPSRVIMGYGKRQPGENPVSDDEWPPSE